MPGRSLPGARRHRLPGAAALSGDVRAHRRSLRGSHVCEGRDVFRGIVRRGMLPQSLSRRRMRRRQALQPAHWALCRDQRVRRDVPERIGMPRVMLPAGALDSTNVRWSHVRRRPVLLQPDLRRQPVRSRDVRRRLAVLERQMREHLPVHSCLPWRELQMCPGILPMRSLVSDRRLLRNGQRLRRQVWLPRSENLLPRAVLQTELSDRRLLRNGQRLRRKVWLSW
jgi:hypothetical protein